MLGDEDMEILYLNPVFKQMIWGGSRMREEYGYDIPGDNTGECWAVSAHPQGDGTIASGEYAGKKLSELFEEKRELFGNIQGDRFPLLTKIIDAESDLSIQVHPDDAYARVHEMAPLENGVLVYTGLQGRCHDCNRSPCKDQTGAGGHGEGGKMEGINS